MKHFHKKFPSKANTRANRMGITLGPIKYAHIHTFHKRLNFLWWCVFSVSILKMCLNRSFRWSIYERHHVSEYFFRKQGVSWPRFDQHVLLFINGVWFHLIILRFSDAWSITKSRNSVVIMIKSGSRFSSSRKTNLYLSSPKNLF